MGVRRDRRGRGLRGALIPVDLPGAATRAQDFDGLVLDAFDRLLPRWGTHLRDIELAVQEVPDLDAGADPGGELVPLARHEPAGGGRPARIVVHRQPVLRRTRDRADRAALLEDVMVEQVADLLGVPPERVDPTWHDPDED